MQHISLLLADVDGTLVTVYRARSGVDPGDPRVDVLGARWA